MRLPSKRGVASGRGVAPRDPKVLQAKLGNPVDRLLDDVEWRRLPDIERVDDDLPFATHEGKLEIAGMSLRCYTLNDGTRVFDADDVRDAFGAGA